MKRLFKADFSGEFVYEVEGDEDALDKAQDCLPEPFTDSIIDSVEEVEEASELPTEWKYRAPLGSDSKEDCDERFERMDDALRVKADLEKAGYEFQDDFIEDLRQAIMRQV